MQAPGDASLLDVCCGKEGSSEERLEWVDAPYAHMRTQVEPAMLRGVNAGVGVPSRGASSRGPSPMGTRTPTRGNQQLDLDEFRAALRACLSGQGPSTAHAHAREHFARTRGALRARGDVRPHGELRMRGELRARDELRARPASTPRAALNQELARGSQKVVGHVLRGGAGSTARGNAVGGSVETKNTRRITRETIIDYKEYRGLEGRAPVATEPVAVENDYYARQVNTGVFQGLNQMPTPQHAKTVGVGLASGQPAGAYQPGYAPIPAHAEQAYAAGQAASRVRPPDGRSMGVQTQSVAAPVGHNIAVQTQAGIRTSAQGQLGAPTSHQHMGTYYVTNARQGGDSTVSHNAENGASVRRPTNTANQVHSAPAIRGVAIARAAMAGQNVSHAAHAGSAYSGGIPIRTDAHRPGIVGHGIQARNASCNLRVGSPVKERPQKLSPRFGPLVQSPLICEKQPESSTLGHTADSPPNNTVDAASPPVVAAPALSPPGSAAPTMSPPVVELPLKSTPIDMIKEASPKSQHQQYDDSHNAIDSHPSKIFERSASEESLDYGPLPGSPEEDSDAENVAPPPFKQITEDFDDSWDGEDTIRALNLEQYAVEGDPVELLVRAIDAGNAGEEPPPPRVPPPRELPEGISFGGAAKGAAALEPVTVLAPRREAGSVRCPRRAVLRANAYLMDWTWDRPDNRPLVAHLKQEVLRAYPYHDLEIA